MQDFGPKGELMAKFRTRSALNAAKRAALDEDNLSTIFYQKYTKMTSLTGAFTFADFKKKLNMRLEIKSNKFSVWTPTF